MAKRVLVLFPLLQVAALLLLLSSVLVNSAAGHRTGSALARLVRRVVHPVSGRLLGTPV